MTRNSQLLQPAHHDQWQRRLCQQRQRCARTPEPPPEVIVLTGTATKVKGFNAAQLSWSGASGAVNVFRDGSTVPLATVSGTSYTDNTGQRGPATYTYQVCEVGDPSNCSNVVTVNF